MRMGERITPDQILDVAQGLMMTKGWNGFSYADIAAALGIRKPSIHHHFKDKATLGLCLLVRYREAFLEALARIERHHEDPRYRLERYIDIYLEVVRQERMCMCGMFAADFDSLPPPLRSHVQEFFADNEKWLTGVLTDGKRKRRLRFTGQPAVAARLFLASLEGAVLVARSNPDKSWFPITARTLLTALGAPPAR